ncbi:hypothetical protein [Candidatus Palauibacter sp.]|uniref:hypothetical protein n=1 Tax=Candidatus Palauibacter sp. TaxID=3101350 RepID=UPI003B520C9D
MSWDSVLPMMTVFAMLVGSVWTMTKLFAQPLERHLNQLDRRIDRLEGRIPELSRARDGPTADQVPHTVMGVPSCSRSSR